MDIDKEELDAFEREMAGRYYGGVERQDAWEWFSARYRAKADLASQDTAPPAAVPAPDKPTWTCFHCSESFHDRAAAELHFGSSEMQEPMCKVDQIKFREMEALMRRYTAEDTDLHREIYRLNTEHNVALRRAEEDGYARGLKAAAPAQAVDALNLIMRDVAELDYSSDTVLDVMQVSEVDLRLIIERHSAALASRPAAPVPEAAQQNGSLVRAALIDLMAVESVALNGATALQQQNDFRARFARGRVALAAPAGEPVASPFDSTWQIVPVIPTEEMEVAFAEVWYSRKRAFDDPEMADAYAAMLAAAPVANAGQEPCITCDGRPPYCGTAVCRHHDEKGSADPFGGAT